MTSVLPSASTFETLMDDYGRMRREDAFRILREARRAPVRVENP